MTIAIHAKHLVIALATVGASGEDENQITLDGLSDGATSLSMPDIELTSNIRTGVDGLQVTTPYARAFGDVGFELMPTSPGVKWFQDRSLDMLNGGQVVIHGEVTNSVTLEAVSLREGTLRVARPFPHFGTDGPSVMPFVVRFADIRADYAKFVGDRVSTA